LIAAASQSLRGKEEGRRRRFSALRNLAEDKDVHPPASHYTFYTYQKAGIEQASSHANWIITGISTRWIAHLALREKRLSAAAVMVSNPLSDAGGGGASAERHEHTTMQILQFKVRTIFYTHPMSIFLHF